MNIYLDAARLLGTPFTDERLGVLAAEYGRNFAATYQRDGRDSVVALFMASHGYMVADKPLEVWSSDHIERLIYNKARQPTRRQLAADKPDAELHPDDGGLGLSMTDANAVLEQLHDPLVVASIDVINPVGPASLGRDDGLVLATALDAGHHLNRRYVVTKDKIFREIGDPRRRVQVLYPHEFVRLVRRARQELGPPPPWVAMKRDS